MEVIRQFQLNVHVLPLGEVGLPHEVLVDAGPDIDDLE